MSDAAVLNIYSDFEPEVKLYRKNALTGATEPATGLLNVQFAFLSDYLDPTSVITGTTIAATERGTTGRYYAIYDTADLVTRLTSYLNQKVWLVLMQSGNLGQEVEAYMVRGYRNMS